MAKFEWLKEKFKGKTDKGELTNPNVESEEVKTVLADEYRDKIAEEDSIEGLHELADDIALDKRLTEEEKTILLERITDKIEGRRRW